MNKSVLIILMLGIIFQLNCNSQTTQFTRNDIHVKDEIYVQLIKKDTLVIKLFSAVKIMKSIKYSNNIDAPQNGFLYICQKE
jgi:hypothetical protein